MTIAEKLTTIAENEQRVYAAGYEKGYEEGEASGGGAIWDGIQNGGTRTDYSSQFNNQYWTDETFNPKHSFAVASNGRAAYMFQHSKIVDGAYIHGDKLDFSNYRNLLSLFNASTVKRLKRIDARKAESGFNGMANMFLSCEQLETIEEFYPSTLTNFVSTFIYCHNLTHCIFCSEIAVDGLNMQDCTKLDKASIISIFTNLQTPQPSGTITLSKEAVDKAFETSPGANDGSTAGNSEYWSLMQYTTGWTIKLV